MPKGKRSSTKQAEAPVARPAEPKVLHGKTGPYWDLGNQTWIGAYR